MNEPDEEKIKRLERENEELRRGLRSISRTEANLGLPPYRLLRYQIQMIRDAVEHILTYDTLEGMKDK